MALEIVDPQPVPQRTYNRVHLVRLEVHQTDQENDNDPSVFRLLIVYKMFRVLADGTREYDHLTGIRRILLRDYLAEAGEHAAHGDTAMLTAFSAVQAGVADVISHCHGLQVSTL